MKSTNAQAPAQCCLDAAKLSKAHRRVKRLATSGRLVAEMKDGEITFTESGSVALVNLCCVLGVAPEAFVNRALEAFLNISK